AAAALASTRPAVPAAVGPRRVGLQELPSTGWGTLEGRVTLDGPAPEGLIKEMNASLMKLMERNNNKDVCLAAPESQRTQQVWRISKDGGVGNVVVWLRPPEGFFFKVDRGHPTWPQDIVLDQPHCAFIPHVMVLFPSYYDPQTRKHRPTGQKLTIRNSAPINHNVQWMGGVRNPGDNITMAPGQQRECSVEPDYQFPIPFRCNIHPWMNAYAWAFDHPYAAVTREDGTYRIPHVPTGVDLQVVAWHEPNTYLTAGGNKGEAVRLKDGANTLNFKLRAPSRR
ncbi:MAG TPA: hypothetical protein VJ739_14050, partial [Gemmataceae bacterium]|nr:hypothetical protein [Gemmataceae bacterium]